MRAIGSIDQVGLTLIAIATVIGAVTCSRSESQEAGVPPAQANVMVDIRIRDLVADKAVGQIPHSKLISFKDAVDSESGITLDQINRISVGVHIPAPGADSTQHGFEIIGKVSFNARLAAEKFGKMLNATRQTTNKFGPENYWIIEQSDLPVPAYFRHADDHSILIGTASYLSQPSRTYTSDLTQDAWDSHEAAKLQFAIDMHDIRPWILAMAEGTPLLSSTMVESIKILEDIELISGRLDISGPKILEISCRIKDKSDIASTKSKLDGLLFLVRSHLNSLLDATEFADMTINQAIRTSIDELTSTQQGNWLHVSVSRPNDFTKAIMALSEIAKRSDEETDHGQ